MIDPPPVRCINSIASRIANIGPRRSVLTISDQCSNGSLGRNGAEALLTNMCTPPKLCEFQQGVDIALLAHICTTKASGSACHLDSPDGPLSTILIDIGNDNDRTFTGEVLGDRTTAAHSPGTGDDCDSIFNIHVTPRLAQSLSRRRDFCGDTANHRSGLTSPPRRSAKSQYVAAICLCDCQKTRRGPWNPEEPVRCVLP